MTAPTIDSPTDVLPAVVSAWAAHDSDAFADLFVAEGTMTLPGRFLQGREKIREFLRAAYAGPYQGTRVTGTPIAITPLAEGAVAVVTEGGVLYAGDQEVQAGNAIRAVWVLSRAEGSWKLAAYQNTPRNAPA
ncbi:SgcJ/EcaC family oxidoreductase [Kineosporia succinea]|uniref:Uncharacterized protein (TIGR02246 family) n=1 Tax=Kineosporia succinea TaxID=84632 RepID=A0ABT9PAH0_9ACTN|nr:SgcJ/EcaC family oxidoreductase [Kineosporia succinea]MDP9829678.1 uncharacterized protein (TIGR02246 family) [Kineosporia succinea]